MYYAAVELIQVMQKNKYCKNQGWWTLIYKKYSKKGENRHLSSDISSAESIQAPVKSDNDTLSVFYLINKKKDLRN